MAKMVDIDKLKPILEPLLTGDDSAKTIEDIMGIAEDYDEASVQKRIDDAVAAAKDEEAKSYSQRLHDMFFKGTDQNKGGNAEDQHTDPEIQGQREVEDIFS